MRAMGTAVAAFVALLAVGVIAGPASAASAASPTAAAPASVEVHLTTDSDVPLHLGLVGVQAGSTENGSTGSGYTTDDGVTTIGNLYGSVPFTVSTFDIPDQGATTFAPAESAPVTLTPGKTTVVRLALHVGATVSGAVVGPTEAPLAGTTITAYQKGAPYTVVETTTDAAGRYQLHGLATGVYSIEGSVTPIGYATLWKTQVVQQRGPLAASHVQLATHYLHSTYDAVLEAESADGSIDAALTGATVRLVGADSSTVVASERFSGIADSLQSVQFVVPSGTYRAQLLLGGRVYWLEQQGLTTSWVADEAEATDLPLVYGWLQGWTGTAP